MTTQPQPDPAPVAGLTALDVGAMERYAESAQPHDVRALCADWRRQAAALRAERNAWEVHAAKLEVDLAALRAELAAVRGALPGAGVLQMAADYLDDLAEGTADETDVEGVIGRLGHAAAAIRALPSAGDGAGREAGT